MRVVVIIPAYNEEKALARVIDDLPRKVVSEVVVVDNASTDNTAEVARAAGATVLAEARRGYGYACQRGIRYASDRSADVVVFLDADYSDYPSEAARLLEPITKGEADFVVGSRMRGTVERGALLPQARYGNWLACMLMRAIWGIRHTDLGPFRAIKLSRLQHLGMRDPTFGWTIEMQIKAHLAGLRVIEVPVSYRCRIGTSKITGTVCGSVRASVKILWTIGALAMQSRSLSRQFAKAPA